MSGPLPMRWLARRWRGVLAVTLVLASVSLGVQYWPRPPLSASVSQSVAVLDRHGKLLRLTLAADQRYRLWTPLGEMPGVESSKLF